MLHRKIPRELEIEIIVRQEHVAQAFEILGLVRFSHSIFGAV